MKGVEREGNRTKKIRKKGRKERQGARMKTKERKQLSIGGTQEGRK